MMTKRAAPLMALLALAPGVAIAQSPRPVPRAGLSWAEADALKVKLEAIEKRADARAAKRKPQTLTVTESELNSFLNLTLAAKIPKELRDVQVRLEKERLQATGLVDLDSLKEKIGSSGLNPLMFMSGFVPVLLRGRFVNEDGFGSIVWEDVRVNAWSVPLRLLEQAVSSATRKADNPDGIDINAPFRLPYAVKRVRLEQGRALLDF
jgi:hypothetical protein